jgi:Flp pilus assembly pilin Flp
MMVCPDAPRGRCSGLQLHLPSLVPLTVRACMLKLTKRFGNSGGTSLEYGLIAAGIAIGITMAVASLGTQLKSTFANLTLSPEASGTASEASGTASGRPAAGKDGP